MEPADASASILGHSIRQKIQLENSQKRTGNYFSTITLKDEESLSLKSEMSIIPDFIMSMSYWDCATFNVHQVEKKDLWRHAQMNTKIYGNLKDKRFLRMRALAKEMTTLAMEVIEGQNRLINEEDGISPEKRAKHQRSINSYLE